MASVCHTTSRSCFRAPKRALILLLVLLVPGRTNAYTNGIPHVTRKALAGLWKLTPSVRSMKEFTVRPRKPAKQQEEEVLLMLKEDGSFTRYEYETTDELEEDDDEDDKAGSHTKQQKDLDQSWKQFLTDKRENKVHQPIKTIFKGTWDYRDGSLILAADRDEQKAKSDNYGSTAATGTSGAAKEESQQHQPSPFQQQHLFWKQGKDTILVGAVVATTTNSLYHPIVPKAEQTSVASTATNTTTTAESSTSQTNKAAPSSSSISVPMGSVQVGKFFYPKSHHSFFDQPIYRPQRIGTFQLKQVLSSLGHVDKEHEEKLIEKFRNSDFHNKMFYITTHPMKPRGPPKGEKRWSIKYNKYVEDTPAAKKKKQEPENQPIPIRVMKVMIHANNTFSTLAGMGGSDATNILRGRFNVIGDKRDQVWMQSVRFGFGRSVSGSLYSEGNALGEETKLYWGKISYEDEGEEGSGDGNSESTPASASSLSPETTEQGEHTDSSKRRLQVTGSVIVGWGLEPQPVARFIMREAEDEDDSELLDDEEDEDEDDDDGVAEWTDDNSDGPIGGGIQEDDLSNGNAFQ